MKNLNIFCAVIAICALASVSENVQAEMASPFTDITRAEQVVGPKIYPDDLRGKVVYVENCGIKCEVSRNSLPHAQEVYTQLSKTGLFFVIGNYVQEYIPEADTFLKEKRITFPVYKQLLLPVEVPRSAGLPRAFLFDVTGKVVAEGPPDLLIPQIPSLLQEAKVMKTLRVFDFMDPSGVPGGLKHPFADSDLGKFQKNALIMFIPGKPWLANYRKLQKAAQSDVNTEAQTALNILDTYLNDEILRLSYLAKSDPAKAYASIDKLNRSIKGMSQELDLADVVKELSADKNVKDLSAILLRIVDFESNVRHMKPVDVKKNAKGLFNSLKTYCDRKNLSKELKKEAFDAARELQEKYGVGSKN